MKKIDDQKAKCSSHRLRDGLLTLIFFLSLLGIGNLIVELFCQSENASYYGRIAVRCVSCAIIIAICIKYYGVKLDFRSRDRNYYHSSALVTCALLGILLACFMLGQEAVEVWILSYYDANIAYAHWSFRQEYLPAWPNLNMEFLVEIITISLIGPLAEEFFFRGVLLNLLIKKYRNIVATLILAAIFVLVHAEHPHVIATIAFSIVLSNLYIRTGSLGLCWIAHGTFNLAALIMENFLWPWFLRSPETLNATENWLGFYLTFILSTLGIAYLYNYLTSTYRFVYLASNR